MSLQDFKERFDKIELEFEEFEGIDINKLEEKVYKLEEEIFEEIQFCSPHEEKTFQNLLKKIKKLKKENDFYDEDAELDRMFPNRNDEDFDEDSMSYDSVFGKD
jgi:predicted nuclease with TOPRIM domain